MSCGPLSPPRGDFAKVEHPLRALRSMLNAITISAAQVAEGEPNDHDRSRIDLARRHNPLSRDRVHVGAVGGAAQAGAGGARPGTLADGIFKCDGAERR